MDLSGVEVFIQVVKTGSFTAAGERLRIPKSTVSRRVTRLEQELGARLIHRTTRQLRLTEVGASFFERVSKAMDDLEEAARSVSDDQDVPRGLLRVTAPIDFGVSYLGEILRSFRELHQEVEVEVEITQRTVNLVEEGFDVALRAGRLADSSLIATKLSDVEFGIFASPEYLAGRPALLTLSDLAAHECLLFRGQSAPHRWTVEGPEGLLEMEVHGGLYGRDFAFLRSAALAHAGVAQLPSFIVAQDVTAGRLTQLLSENTAILGALYLVYPTARQLSAKVRAFREHLMSHLAAQPWTRRGHREAQNPR